jgi:hypothetical protein
MLLPSFLLVATAASTGACVVTPAEVSRQALLAYAAFDGQPAPTGWRSLSGSGCVDAAVALLGAYEAANASRLRPAESMELSFHTGQVLALAGREQESISHFERSLRNDATPEWRGYVEATLAFLRRDLEALKAAHVRYSAVAPGSMRLRFIKGFLACPNEPYAKAVHCGT